MSAIDDPLEKLLKADELLGVWYRAMDKEWERLKEEHNKRAGNPFGFTAHIEEMSKQAIASVKEDPRPQVFPLLDEVADAFLKVTPEERTTLSDFFADCKSLERVHRGYAG